MSINIISSSNQYAPAQQSYAAPATQVRKSDNDGDYDKGTGRDDVAQKALQAAAQPHLGSNINIQV